VGDARHRCGAGGDELRHFKIGKVLIKEHHDSPSVRERFELCDGAQIAQEATVLDLRPKREQRVGQLVEPIDFLDALCRRGAA
jgi:hypothetical protein